MGSDGVGSRLDNKVTGFNTCGEQIDALHVNHPLTRLQFLLYPLQQREQLAKHLRYRRLWFSEPRGGQVAPHA